jgi:predicted glycogen debranching enzyme
MEYAGEHARGAPAAMSLVARFGREVCGDLPQALRREWLVTNGLGGYGAGTVAGCQTRRYHGLLVAALLPPVGRTVLLVDLDASAEVDGVKHALATHEYSDGTINPTGHRLIESFALEGTVPTWTYALGAARLTKRVFMALGRNTTYVTFTLDRALAPLALTVRPLCTGRDYHWQRRGGDGYHSEATAGGCRVAASGIGAVLELGADAGRFILAPDMHWNLRHRVEAARGLDADEDLYVPGTFEVTLEEGMTVAFTASVESEPASAASALAERRAHETRLQSAAPAAPAWIRQLLLAADQFLVARRAPGEASGTPVGSTIIAGYPWFSDWGRDTMIALPGLTLATGRAPLAAQILRTFARHVDEGLLPNRFPDAGEAPEYNTVDATLWYFVALHAYCEHTADLGLARELLPVLVGIIDWHRRGTRHGIRVDPEDGLLRAGEPGVQLTWMDAKVGDWVVTPRIGKPVEINALWCNALAILRDLAVQLGETDAARALDAPCQLAFGSFARKFWYAEGGYLYDVIDGPDGAARDTALRPNQLLALSLPHVVLEDTRARSVLEACERELLTSCGLRTLSPGSPGYAPYYAGDSWHRDGAYHQGTIWPWLLGAFSRAHLRLHGDAARAAAYLAPLEQHLADACVGQVSEIFDAEAPHKPEGCFAQAWSVAEVLRAWTDIHAGADDASPQPTPPRVPRARRVLTRKAP